VSRAIIFRVLAAALSLMLTGTALAEPLRASKPVSLRKAVDDLTLAAANHDMVLVKVQPIDSALVKRGFDDPHVRILVIGSETAVRWAEAAEPRLLNLLPLRLTLIQRDDAVLVLSDDFTAWRREFPDNPANLLLKAWESEIKALFDDFVSQ
jgi:hypothetical protein